MTDASVESTPETSEGRKARQHKTAIANVLDELIETMEAARQDGFTVEFGVAMDNQQSRYIVSSLAVLKRW